MNPRRLATRTVVALIVLFLLIPFSGYAQSSCEDLCRGVGDAFVIFGKSVGILAAAVLGIFAFMFAFAFLGFFTELFSWPLGVKEFDFFKDAEGARKTLTFFITLALSGGSLAGTILFFESFLRNPDWVIFLFFAAVITLFSFASTRLIIPILSKKRKKRILETQR